MRKTVYGKELELGSFGGRRGRWAWGRGALAVVLAGSLTLVGCSGGTYGDGAAEGDSGADSMARDEGTSEGSVDWASLIDIEGMDFSYSDRDLDGSYDAASATAIALTGSGATVTGAGAVAEGATVTISAAGTYVVSGSLDDGELIVAVGENDKVQVVLDGASIRHSDGAALNIQEADKVFVTLAAGSQNTLADGAEYALAEGEDEPNAALYSRADLTINGAGALTVEGAYRHGVNSKDDLVVTGGTLVVTAAEDGLRGKDCVKIADGSLTIAAGEDGIQSSNDEDPTRGFVAIDGGTFAIDAGDEGVQAATYLRVAGGEGAVTAADHAFRSEVEAAMTGGDFTVEAGGKGMNPETRFTMDGGSLTVTGCDEGIEAEKVIINDGVLNIVASDDGINAAVAERSDEAAAESGASAGAAAETGSEDAAGEASREAAAAPQGGKGVGGMQGSGADGGDFQPSAGGEGQMPEPPEGVDGAQAGERPELPEGFDPQNMPQAGERPELPEGMEEGQMPPRPDGEQGAGDAMPQDGRGGGAGPLGANASEDCLIQINGGSVTIQAGGDAVDSNGYIEVAGGVLLGASSGNGDGALDYEYGATITGGTVLLAGAAGMAETFTEGTQPFALVMAQGAAGSAVAVADAAGATVVDYTAPVAFQCVIVSAPQFAEGDTGAVIVDGAATEFAASTTPAAAGMGGQRGGVRGGDARDARGNATGAQDADATPRQSRDGASQPQGQDSAAEALV